MIFLLFRKKGDFYNILEIYNLNYVKNIIYAFISRSDASYSINTLYNRKNYETYVTESVYYDIKNAKYPTLYYR